MKIGFDAKRAAQNRTGLGNYSRFVVRILSQQMPQHSYHLYVPNQKRMPFLAEIATIRQLLLHFPTSWFSSKLPAIWRTWGVASDLKKEGITLYHGLSNELPLSMKQAGCKSIVTIHDLIFLRAPQYYTPIDRIIYNYKFKKACQLADCIIAVSQFTKQDIVAYYGVSPEKIEVVYQGCDAAFATAVSADKKSEVAKKYRLPHRYLLYVGSIEERKNLLLVAKALKEAPADVQVVAVGKRTPYQAEVEHYVAAQGWSEQITFLNDVPFADLPTIYQLAHLFVYPSRIEGFGIPLLEALNSGVPVIGCTGSCLEEAGGPGSLYVSPDSPQELASAINQVWGNETVRQQMIEAGKRYATNFDDQRLAEQMMAVYKKVIEG